MAGSIGLIVVIVVCYEEARRQRSILYILATYVHIERDAERRVNEAILLGGQVDENRHRARIASMAALCLERSSSELAHSIIDDQP